MASGIGRAPLRITPSTGGAVTFPVIKTARQLVEDGVLPISEDYVKALAKRHQVGRKIGRTLVFEPSDIRQLLDALPCPSPSKNAAASGTSAALCEESAYTKALAFVTAQKRKKLGSRSKRTRLNGQSTVTPFPGPSLKLP